MFTDNLILSTDSYKFSHFLQYPAGTEHIWSYIEPRGGKFNKVLYFGLQMFLKQYLSKPITKENIDEAEEFASYHGEPFNREGWEIILNEHDGYMPVKIKAASEGLLIDNHNILTSIENTDPRVPWITNFLETTLLRGVWYPTTVATISFNCKVAILKALYKSSDDPENQIWFKLHDFGARGVESSESAAIGGCSHLINFMGTDTIEGVMAARKFYNKFMAGNSIPAAEHSTITSWGIDHEANAYENMIDQFGGNGKMVAVVSDSYNIWDAVDKIWGEQLKEKVITNGGTIVVRPDSGDPLIVPIQVVEKLSNKFGFSVNSKGYKVLPSYIRVIQGDGINIDSLPIILDNLLKAGFSADNLGFGMGGGLLQQCNRDTLKFACKASAVSINGIWRDVYKCQVTDKGKVSKAGRLALSYNDNTNQYYTTKIDNNVKDMLETRYENGKIIKEYNFDDIRNLAHQEAIKMAKS